MNTIASLYHVLARIVGRPRDDETALVVLRRPGPAAGCGGEVR